MTTHVTTDPIRLLKEDHDKVKELFKQFSDAGESAYEKKARLAEKIFHELEVHSKIEEEIFYPAIREGAAEELVKEGLEEHHVVDVVIAELKKMTPKDEQYDAKFAVLCENVQHHIEEEEGEMFPKAKKTLSKNSEAVGEKLARRKEQLQKAR